MKAPFPTCVILAGLFLAAPPARSRAAPGAVAVSGETAYLGGWTNQAIDPGGYQGWLVTADLGGMVQSPPLIPPMPVGRQVASNSTTGRAPSEFPEIPGNAFWRRR